MQPLEGLDAAFLAMEAGGAPLHVAVVVVLDPPEDRRPARPAGARVAAIRRLVEQRLHLVPQLRQRVQRLPLGLQHPVWVDDPELDLDHHVRRARLPEPGTDAELGELVAELVAQPLDPDRPLWEMVVVEGLAGDREALVAKVHHAVADGVAGASLLAALLDRADTADTADAADAADRDPGSGPAAGDGHGWSPAPPPGPSSLLAYAASAARRSPGEARALLERGLDAMVDVAGQNRRLAELGTAPPPPPWSAPRTSMNGAVSARRRYATAAVPVEEARLVGRRFGATVNDVVLAGVAGALRRRLDGRGERPDRPLVALVPVSTRGRRGRRSGPQAEVEAGNRLSGMLVSLATDVDDPVARLRAVARASRVARSQERLAGGPLLAEVAQVVPPAVVARVARVVSGPALAGRLRPVCNVVVSSVPGPADVLWFAGRPVAALYPVGPVAAGVGLNVTCMTYRRTLHLGFLGCRRLVPDVGALARLFVESVEELAAAVVEDRADPPHLRRPAG